MRILVTRPAEDALDTATRLARRGHKAIIAPLLVITLCDGAPVALDGVQAILATSSNGVRALARRTERRDVPLFVVGAHTALIAQQLGFARVKSADGDADLLAKKVPEWADAGKGALLHATGENTPGPLANALEARGFDVGTLMLYRATTVSALPEAARQAITSRSLDGVLLFSPRTAGTFASLVEREGLGQYCRGLVACCISRRAAAALAALALADVRVAANSDQESLLGLLG